MQFILCLVLQLDGIINYYCNYHLCRISRPQRLMGHSILRTFSEKKKKNLHLPSIFDV